jgi:hypothetical protein
VADGGVDARGGTGSPVRWALRWVFINRRTGRITVVQWPNLALGIFIAASLALRIFHPSGTADRILRIGADVAIIVWSLDELVRGVNPFRRMLGLGLLVSTVLSLTLFAH